MFLHPRSYDKNSIFIEHFFFRQFQIPAYQIHSYEEDKFIILEKNPYYYNNEKVQINKSDLLLYGDLLSQMNMYLTGQANMTVANISSEDIPYLEEN